MSTAKLRYTFIASLALAAAAFFGSFAAAQDEPTSGFRARIENDWAR